MFNLEDATTVYVYKEVIVPGILALIVIAFLLFIFLGNFIDNYKMQKKKKDERTKKIKAHREQGCKFLKPKIVYENQYWNRVCCEDCGKEIFSVERGDKSYEKLF